MPSRLPVLLVTLFLRQAPPPVSLLDTRSALLSATALLPQVQRLTSTGLSLSSCVVHWRCAHHDTPDALGRAVIARTYGVGARGTEGRAFVHPPGTPPLHRCSRLF